MSIVKLSIVKEYLQDVMLTQTEKEKATKRAVEAESCCFSYFFLSLY